MDLNYVAVFTAALSTFLIGGLWYSPLLFGNAWRRANGFSPQGPQKGGTGAIFAWSFVFSLIMAANLAAFLGPDATLGFGAMAGAAAGIGWVGLGIAVVALFERRPWSYTLINGGYWAVSFTVMGAILGVWH